MDLNRSRSRSQNKHKCNVIVQTLGGITVWSGIVKDYWELDRNIRTKLDNDNRRNVVYRFVYDGEVRSWPSPGELNQLIKSNDDITLRVILYPVVKVLVDLRNNTGWIDEWNPRRKVVEMDQPGYFTPQQIGGIKHIESVNNRPHGWKDKTLADLSRETDNAIVLIRADPVRGWW